MSLNQTNEILDVVIIGGGLVGGLTALLLAQGGVQPTVLDAAPILDADKTLKVANPRVLALSQATIHLLKRWVSGKIWHVSSLIPVCRCGIKMAMAKLILASLQKKHHQ